MGVSIKMDKHCCGSSCKCGTNSNIETKVDHESLGGLMGGDSSGHYHITLDQLTKIANLTDDDNSKELQKLINNVTEITEIIKLKDELERLSKLDIDKINRLVNIVDKLEELANLDLDSLKSGPELNYSVELTATNVADRYIELPEDCDITQVVTVMLDNVHQHEGTAWEIIEYEKPKKDRISWRGLDMMDIAEVGSTMCVTYHAKS